MVERDVGMEEGFSLDAEAVGNVGEVVGWWGGVLGVIVLLGEGCVPRRRCAVEVDVLVDVVVVVVVFFLSGMSWGFSADGSGSDANAESDTLSSAEEEESAVVSERSSGKEPGTGAELERGALMVMVRFEVEVETERETDWAEGLGGSSMMLGGDGGRNRTREGLGDGLERKGRVGRPRWAMSRLKRRRTRRRPTSYQKKGAMSAKTRPRAVQSTTRAIL